MNNKEAIECIRKNWPDCRYSMLREALEKAIATLEAVELGDVPNKPSVPFGCTECGVVNGHWHTCSKNHIVPNETDVQQLKQAIALVREQSKINLIGNENINLQAYLLILEQRREEAWRSSVRPEGN
jgi:hypothetical protein